jgi:hypothetical protein
MKGLLIIAMSLPLSSFATVVDLQKEPVHQVLDVYEQQREEEAHDQSWIHSFEEDSLGKEMDHLTKVKIRKEKLESLNQ